MYKYVSTKHPKSKLLSNYPNVGPYPNIKGIRELSWGKKALVVKSGVYAYNLSSNPNFFYSL